MNLPDNLLPPFWTWLANGALAALMAYVLYSRPWNAIRASEHSNVFMGACVALMLLWSIKAGVSPGLTFHPLGVTVLTLMFGWRLAVIAATVIVFGITLNGMGGWHTFGLNVLLTGVVPAVVSYAIYRVVDQRLPNNFFVYIFACAFLGGGFAVAVSAFGIAGVLVGSGAYPLERIIYEYLPFFPLIILPEALLNGMVMTVLVGLRPQWVSTFDDSRYINNK